MLSNSTLGDPELFKGESASQLVTQFLNRITEEETAKRKQAEEENDNLQTENDRLIGELSANTTHFSQKANKIGKGTASIVLTCFYILISFSFIVGTTAFFVSNISVIWQVISFSVLTLLTVFGFSHKFSSESIRNPIIKYIENKVISFFSK